MGNYFLCRDHCPNTFCTHSKGKLLKLRYRKLLRGSYFKDICLHTIDHNFSESRQVEKEEILRKSMIHQSHYEANSLNYSVEHEEVEGVANQQGSRQGGLPSCNNSAGKEQRERYLINLIKESYLLVDLTDCLDQMDTPTASYQSCVKHEIMNNDHLLDSFIRDATALDRVQQCLRSYKPEIVAMLSNYVRFCRKVNHDFSPDNERFLGKLSLNLQSEIIRKYASNDFRDRRQLLISLIEDTTEAIRILSLTVEIFYEISSKAEGEDGEGYDFFNETNIYTMVSSLFFQGEDFYRFILDKMKECFKPKVKLYRREADFTSSMFVNDFIELNSRDSRRLSNIRTELDNLLQSCSYSYSELVIFGKSRKMLPKILERQAPLFKLKVIYELDKQMNKQLEELKQTLSRKYGIQINNVFNRETDYLIVKWLLKNSKAEIEAYCCQLMFTYLFMHEDYRKDRKGSCLITFMQEVERIVQWNAPSTS